MEDLVLTEEKMAENRAERLFISLCRYLNLDEAKDAGTYVATSLGALEYACVIAKTLGIGKEAFLESVSNVWGRVHGEGPVREQEPIRDEEGS